LKEQDAGHDTCNVCLQQGFTEGPFYQPEATYGSLHMSEAKRLGLTEDEDRRLTTLLADAQLTCEADSYITLP